MLEDQIREEELAQLCYCLTHADLDTIAEALSEVLWSHHWEEIKKLVDASYGV